MAFERLKEQTLSMMISLYGAKMKRAMIEHSEMFLREPERKVLS